jgi:hypothetical protein
MAGIYCGSNSLNPQLVANGGVKTIGSRHQCLRKGIGQGLHMPLDLGYNSPYQAIDPRRFYCGDSAVLPAGYTANGTLQQCFNTGIGVGRRQLAQRAIAGGGVAGGGVLALAPPIAAVPVGVVAPKHFLYYILVFLLANAVFIISFLYARPSFIETKDKEINWAVFSPYIAIFALVSAAILYRIYIL